MAYTSARHKQFETAADRFAMARNIAASLPDHGARPVVLGDAEAGIEEEAAFQHAVCVGAEGRKTAAEEEYRDFLRRYPTSILIHATTKRIARFHGGSLPADAEALWRADMKLQRKQVLAQERERSLCGPECLAELLRRQGKRPDVHALAAEMKTDEHGTTLAALAAAAQRHGFTPQGLRLTQAGLARQQLPAVAYLRSSHYVLVDRVAPTGVTIWDPDAKGPGKAAPQEIASAQWGQAWNGVALAVK